MIAAPRHTSKAALALLILFVVPMLTGCGGSNSVSSPPPPPPPTPSEFLYVSGSVGELFGFSIDPNSGALAHKVRTPYGCRSRRNCADGSRPQRHEYLRQQGVA